jgi:hypothetical protein
LKFDYYQQTGKIRFKLSKEADPMIKKWRSYLLISIFVFFVTGLFSCETAKVTPRPAPISTFTPTSRYTTTSYHTPTSPPNVRLNKLDTLGEGILPQVIYSHDGTKVFLSDGYSLSILNKEDQKEITSIEISEDGYGGVIEISPDDRYIIFTGLFGFNVFDINSEEVVAYGYGGNGSAVGPVFTKDSRFVVYRAADRSTGGPYHSICSIDLNVPEVAEEGQNCYPTLPNYRYDVMSDPAVSPNGEMVAAGYSDSTHNILYI